MAQRSSSRRSKAKRLRLSPQMKQLIGVAVSAGVMYGMQKLMETLDRKGFRTDLGGAKLAGAR